MFLPLRKLLKRFLRGLDQLSLNGEEALAQVALFLAGERCDPDTLLWAQNQLGVPVIDHWWQTETGWPISANPLGLEMLPVKPGSATRPNRARTGFPEWTD